MSAIIIVLDSVGIGAAPDAAAYGDAGSNTLGHLAEAAGGLHAPNLQRLGLGNIPALLPHGIQIQGVPTTQHPLASFGAMQEKSRGKDTTTGHWEIAGLYLEQGFYLFPKTVPCFPRDLIASFEEQTGRAVIGNKHASGTAIIEELGAQHMKEGAWIAYTSADSVFQIAAHESTVPLDELYAACTIARQLCNPLSVGRIIARPFVGTPGHFTRTQNRRDYSFPLPEKTILDRLSETGHCVTTVGKLDDIFDHQGITQTYHVENSADAENATLEIVRSGQEGLIFVNLIDFDMLYGHRRNPDGYARAIEKTDIFLGRLMKELTREDVLIITADHGNDPTHEGTDHTREYVPLLVYQKDHTGQALGIRQGFYDVAQSLASHFGIERMPRGETFLPL